MCVNSVARQLSMLPLWGPNDVHITSGYKWSSFVFPLLFSPQKLIKWLKNVLWKVRRFNLTELCDLEKGVKMSLFKHTGSKLPSQTVGKRWREPRWRQPLVSYAHFQWHHQGQKKMFRSLKVFWYYWGRLWLSSILTLMNIFLSGVAPCWILKTMQV